MALQVNLTLNKTYFLPGEVVQVCVQIVNDSEGSGTALDGPLAPKVLQVKELSFQAYGSERTDSSFIHRLHRQDVPVDTSDARKRVRSIFTTETAVLVNNQVLAPHAAKDFQLRFRLPTALPPSFRGSAVRFLYLIQVKAVYEVHRADVEAVVYETVASTSLMVWPSSAPSTASVGAPACSMAGSDRRLSSLEMPGASLGANRAEAPADEMLGLPAVRSEPAHSDSNTGARFARTGSSGGGMLDRDQRLNSSEAATLASLHGAAAHTQTPALTSPSSNAPGGGVSVGHAVGTDDNDVPLCDYVLGRKCRIRWQEISTGRDGLNGAGGIDGSAGDNASAIPSCSGFLPGGNSGALVSSSSFGSVGTAGMPLRGVIPFGVNRPFAPHALQQTVEDSDVDDECREERRLGNQDISGNAHVQRQVSNGNPGGSVGALGPFGRQQSRRGSLFGKVYALNVGDQPLLRVLLQAPLELPLQPGATFGGVLDFRQPLLAAASDAGRTERKEAACFDVAVLLESEEVISADCRPHPKRDGSGVPAGTPYIVRRLHAEHHELTCDNALTSFTFSLPVTATPSFRTPMVSLRWVLRFELSVGPRLDFAAMDKRARSPRPQLEQLVWSLPLVVRAPTAMPR